MTVNVQGLRNAADYMRQTTGIDPDWLRAAADEIERQVCDLGELHLEVSRLREKIEQAKAELAKPDLYGDRVVAALEILGEA